MEEVNAIANFKTINEDIKALLQEIDEHIAAHPYFDYSALNKNNEAFIEMLDKLLDARCSIEELKKYTLSQ
jgi:hypothetical protein